MSKAFTLIELLVVVSIIVLITALTLPNYRFGDKQLALQRSAHKVAQSLRMAQEYAISAKDFNGTMPSGYGIYFALNQPTAYVLFADLDGNRAYSGINEKVEEISLESNIIFSDLVSGTSQSSLSIVFIPPDPTIIFNPDSSLSVITLAASGAETLATQYTYNSVFSTWDWVSPRADCDTSDNNIDCPGSFSALESDPPYVYDWYKLLLILNFSRAFEKQASQGVAALEKSVEVNKAGLISVQ